MGIGVAPMKSTASLRKFADSLRALPRVVGARVAQAVAPILTRLALETARASEDAYGVGWAPGVDGGVLTLRKSGALLDGIRYVAIGDRVRLALTNRYAKYQVGPRPVAPPFGAPLPPAYAKALDEASAEVIREAIS